MKLEIINEETRDHFMIYGKLKDMYCNGHVTRLTIESTFSDIFSFEQEAKQNEDGLKSIGLDIDNKEIAYRKLSDRVEYFIIPKGFGVRITE